MEYTIQIVFCPKPKGRLNAWLVRIAQSNFGIRYHPTQGTPFVSNVLVKNLGTNVFERGAITGIKITSLKGLELMHPSAREIRIPTLNPQEETELNLGVNQTYLDGLAWIRFDIRIDGVTDAQIRTFQMGQDEGVEQSSFLNTWGDSFFIKSRTEVSQGRLNQLVFILTLLAFLHGVWGLGTVFWGALDLLKSCLLSIANLIP